MIDEKTFNQVMELLDEYRRTDSKILKKEILRLIHLITTPKLEFIRNELQG